MMEHLITVAFNWFSAHPQAVLAGVAGGGGLAVGLETFLNTAKVKSKAIAYSLIHILGIITAIASYFLANLPTTDVPAIYGSLVILAQTWHRFVVSPAYNKFLIPYLQYLSSQKVPNVAGTPAPLPPETGLVTTESNFESKV
jgi:hypothetical protein